MYECEEELLSSDLVNQLVAKALSKGAEFESEGVAHLTKSLVSLTTNVNDVHYDDFTVKAAPASKEEK